MLLQSLDYRFTVISAIKFLTEKIVSFKFGCGKFVVTFTSIRDGFGVLQLMRVEVALKAFVSEVDCSSFLSLLNASAFNNKSPSILISTDWLLYLTSFEMHSEFTASERKGFIR